MKKIIGIAGVLLLTVGMLAGCSPKFYTEEELGQLHDVIDYVETSQLAFEYVVNQSLPTRIGEKVAADYDFIDFVSTRKYDPEKPMLALTFDDGPRNESTNAILDVLEQYGAKATFFVVGENVGSGTEDTLKRMVSLGCEVANHTMYHTYLTTLDADGMREAIESNDQRIKEYTGQTCRLLRPPGGFVDDTLQQTSKEPLIMWEVDTRDWESRDASKIIPIAEGYASDGTIILMHDLYNSTASAVKEIVPYLVDQGYQLVTVSELAYLKGVKLEAGQKYYRIESEEE